MKRIDQKIEADVQRLVTYRIAQYGLDSIREQHITVSTRGHVVFILIDRDGEPTIEGWERTQSAG